MDDYVNANSSETKIASTTLGIKDILDGKFNQTNKTALPDAVRVKQHQQGHEHLVIACDALNILDSLFLIEYKVV